MPLIDYKLSGTGDTCDAAEMNTLFAELDRKTALALDGHCLPYLIQTDATVARRFFSPYFGQSFHFVSGSQPISGFFGTWNYDHSVFQNAVASSTVFAGTPTRPTSEYQFVRINSLDASFFTQIGKIKSNANTTLDWRNTQTLFRWSLEAHKRAYTPPGEDEGQFWIYEMNIINADNAYLNRIRTYQQAELIFEGGVTSLTFRGEWNAFNFFRINVCQSQSVTITFKNTLGATAHTVTVPGYGSQCVRRTGVDGTYTDGFKYFHKFIHGDRRFYQHPSPNNIVNPSIVIPFVNRVLAGQRFTDEITGELNRQFAAPTVMLDPQVKAPLPSGYEYGDPSVAETKIGDCLHHKGTIKQVDNSTNPPTVTGLSFNGYDDLSAFATQEVGDDLQIKSLTAGTVDFMSISSNLLCTNGGNFIAAPIKDASDWITLDRHMPSNPPSLALAYAQANQTISYLPPGGAGNGGSTGTAVSQTITRRTAQLSTTYPVDTIVPHRTTCGESIERVASYGTNCTFSSTSLQLTSSGLVLLTTQTIPLDRPFITSNPAVVGTSNPDYTLAAFLASPVIPVLSSTLRHCIELSGNNLVIKRAIVFDGYGFPDTDNWTYTGFLSPRQTRVYYDRPTTSNPTVAGLHPFFSQGYRNTDGQENKCTGVGGGGLQTEIAILSPWNSRNDTFNSDAQDYSVLDVIGTMSNNDVLYGATKNVGVSGYWSGNRSRLLTNRIYRNSTPDGSDFTEVPGSPYAVQFYRFHRMRMQIEHYNNLAAKVNSMVRYKPLNAIDHGVIQNGVDQTLRYRLTPNKYGLDSAIQTTPYWSSISTADKNSHLMRFKQLAGIRPADQFCASVLTDANMTAAGYAGITVLGVSDLPDSFSTLKGTSDLDNLLHINPDTVTATESARKTRPELNGLSTYNWISTGSVQAYFEARGYKFIHAVLGVGMSFEVFNASPVVTYKRDSSPFPVAPRQRIFLSRQLEFVPTDGDGSWICGNDSSAIQLQEMNWADDCNVCAFDDSGRFVWAVWSVAYPERLRRIFWNNPNRTSNLPGPTYCFAYTARNPGGKQVGETPYTTDIICRAEMLVKNLSAGVEDNSQVIQTPIPFFKFTPGFSSTSQAALFAVGATNDGRCYPFTVESAGAYRLQLWADFSSAF